MNKKDLIKAKKLRKIGRGMFADCYVSDEENRVYSFVEDRERDNDTSREAIANWADMTNPHVPKFERLGVYKDGAKWGQLYTSPFYYAITKRSQAEKDFRVLVKIFDALDWREFSFAYDFNMEFLNRLYMYDDGEKISPRLYEAVESMINAVSNCGDNFKLEIARRNLKMDEEGRLVLLDLFFPTKR